MTRGIPIPVVFKLEYKNLKLKSMTLKTHFLYLEQGGSPSLKENIFWLHIPDAFSPKILDVKLVRMEKHLVFYVYCNFLSCYIKCFSNKSTKKICISGFTFSFNFLENMILSN